METTNEKITLMKAATVRRYGSPDVVRIEEIARPAPGDGDVLIRIRATAVNSGDSRVRGLNVPPGFGIFVRLMFGFTGPRQPVLGTVLAGEVEAVGKDVSRFRAGDAVFAMDGAGMGGHAQYKVMPEGGAIARKPDNLTFEEAAALPFGGLTALAYLRDKAQIRTGEKILINGASGAVGIAAVQLARHFGAEVTGVCSTANVELVKSLGAHKVIDYTREEVTPEGETYDIIMDNVGNLSFAGVKHALAERGRLLLVVAGMPDMLKMIATNLTGRKKVYAGPAEERPDDLRLLAELAGTGAFRPVIDRSYPLEEIAEAYRYVDGGHKRGSVVVGVG